LTLTPDLSLANYAQKVKDLMASASPVSLAEIEVLMEGRPSKWNDFLKILELTIFNDSFWKENFEENFTVFAYKDSFGVWPGYIVKLRPGRPPLLFQNQLIAALENSPTTPLKNFFLDNPGLRSAFKDGQIFEEPVRIAEFEQANFVYGWFFNQYLIISTSLEGLDQAIVLF